MGKTTELDKDLADGLKSAKSKRCYFVLVLKGGTDGALLVSKSKIGAPAIAEAKKKSGGSAVVSGLVSYADSTYLFETAKSPPATAAQATKTIVKRDAELSIKAVFRMGTDPELLADAGAPSATTSQKPQPTAPVKKPLATAPVEKTDKPPVAATGMHRLNDLTPSIKAAITAGGPGVARIQSLLAAAAGLLKNNDLAQAEKVLDELEPSSGSLPRSRASPIWRPNGRRSWPSGHRPSRQRSWPRG